MMGGHHAASGAAAWVAIASTGPYALGWYPLDPTGIVIGGMATAGTALVCDWDHRSSTVAHALPPLSNLIAVGIENASGGHRQGTHSVLGAACFVLLAAMAGQIQLQTAWGLLSVGAGLLCMFMINIAAKALKLFPKYGWISNWVFALTMAGLVTWFAPHQWSWLPVLKDVWKANGAFSIPLLGRAGSRREWFVLIPVSAYAMVGMFSAVLALAKGHFPAALALGTALVPRLLAAVGG